MNAIHITASPNGSAAIWPSTTLSLDVPVGSVYGFIGPNGSGKTTTMRMILNILLPDRGQIEVFGDPNTSSRATNRVSARRTRSLQENEGPPAPAVLRRLKGRSVKPIDVAIE